MLSYAAQKGNEQQVKKVMLKQPIHPSIKYDSRVTKYNYNFRKISD